MDIDNQKNTVRVERSAVIAPAAAAKLPGIRVLVVEPGKYNVTFQNGIQPEDIVRSSLVAMHLAAASKELGARTREAIAANIGGWLKSVGVENTADDVIRRQKNEIAALKEQVKALGGEGQP